MQTMDESNRIKAYNLNPFINLSNFLNAIFCCFGLLLLTVLIRKFFGFKLSFQKLPPGPKGWPFIGNLFQIKQYYICGFVDFVKEYGPIFTLHAVSTPMIFIADGEILHEAFIEKGSSFSSRPSGGPSSALFSSNYRNISSSFYGSVWRTLRKNFVSGFMGTFKASNFRNVREEVVQDLLRKLKDEASHNGGVVRLREIIRHGVVDLMFAMCFGKRMDERAVLDVTRVLKQILLRSRNDIDEFIPWLRFFPTKRVAKRQQLRQRQVSVLLPFIKEAQRLRQDGNLPNSSYIDSLLALDLEGQKLSDDELVSLCSEFLNAGSDTTSTTLEWAIANIISHPPVQAQIKIEIEEVVGNRAVREEDIDKLQYLEAVVKETLRRHPPGYITLPHAVSQPCKLKGYDIPSNAFVFACIRFISSSPRIWDDPMEFKPERFLSADFDITGSKKITMIPFGIGRRICPGLGLAMLHLNFILARFMQSLEWSTAAPGEAIDLSSVPEFTMVMKSPLRALIRSR